MEIGDGRIERDPWWRRDVPIATAIFVIGLVIRLAHLQQIAAHDPYFTIPSVDGAVYDAWAREMLAGDWLGEGVLFMGPLYPLFMTLVYAVFGTSLAAIKAVQAVLGAIVCVLVWGIAREAFERRSAAALAGLFAAFHGMLIFYGGTVMVVNLQVPLVMGFVWAWMHALRRPSFARWALCGLLLGLSVLSRQTTLLLAPLVVLWLVLDPASSLPREKRIAFAATFGTVLLLLILPFTIRNYVVADDLVLLNSMGGPNFYMGNQRKADGTWQPPSLGSRVRVDNPKTMQREFRRAAEQSTGHPMKTSEVSSHWLARGIEEIAEDPLRWIRLEARKLGLFFNAYEVWNNRSIEISRSFSRVLQLPLPGFGLIAPLGLLGMALARRRWRTLVPIYSTLLVYLASALLFFVLSRYRMPATVLFIPWAAFASVEIVEGLRRRELRFLGIAVASLALLTLLVHLPLASVNRMHMAWYNLGNKYKELERWEEATTAYRASLRENPNAISTHNNLALAFEGAGRREDAIEAWKIVGAMALKRGDGVRLERSTRHLRELGALEDPAANGRSPEGLRPQE